jgi:vitamin B12 transporter
MESKDEDTGLDLLRRPKDKFTAGMDLRLFGGLDCDVRLSRIGRRSDLDFNAWPSAPIVLDAYTLLDAVFSIPARPGVEIFLKLENILDQRYEMIYGYGAPGFCAYAGIRIGK